MHSAYKDAGGGGGSHSEDSNEDFLQSHYDGSSSFLNSVEMDRDNQYFNPRDPSAVRIGADL